MDQILAKALNQAVLFAVRLGISIASGYAIKTLGRYVDLLPLGERQRLVAKKTRLQQKIEVVSVSLELVKLALGRNSVLEILLDLVNDLFLRFNEFGDRVSQLETTTAKEPAKMLELYMDTLNREILEAVPVINLVLTTLGVDMTQSLNRMSAGDLMRAATLILDPKTKPKFDTVMYSVFYNGSGTVDGLQWKEEYARATVQITRDKPKKSAKLKSKASKGLINYTLTIDESFDDGRYHDDEDKPRSQRYSVAQVERMFYSAGGRLLRLDSRDTPVLILKLAVENDGHRWLALGGWKDSDDDDDDDDDSDDASETASDDDDDDDDNSKPEKQSPFPYLLTLLEYMIRLAKAEIGEQKPVLTLHDEVLNAYLKDDIDHVAKEVAPPTISEKQRQHHHHQTVVTDSTMSSNVNRLDKLKLSDDADDKADT